MLVCWVRRGVSGPSISVYTSMIGVSSSNSLVNVKRVLTLEEREAAVCGVLAEGACMARATTRFGQRQESSDSSFDPSWYSSGTYLVEIARRYLFKMNSESCSDLTHTHVTCEYPPSGDAVLALVEEHGGERVPHGRVEIGVREDYEGRLAT